ncbi:MAG: hypothetical protein KJ941_07980 [Bacteroidetes bacterium]|nr:hypothetical protein [Bacteroidota bacterium]
MRIISSILVFLFMVPMNLWLNTIDYMGTRYEHDTFIPHEKSLKIQNIPTFQIQEDVLEEFLIVQNVSYIEQTMNTVLGFFKHGKEETFVYEHFTPPDLLM